LNIILENFAIVMIGELSFNWLFAQHFKLIVNWDSSIATNTDAYDVESNVS